MASKREAINHMCAVVAEVYQLVGGYMIENQEVRERALDLLYGLMCDYDGYYDEKLFDYYTNQIESTKIKLDK